MGVGAGLYMCDVVKKSSRSLSHLLMSFLFNYCNLFNGGCVDNCLGMFEKIGPCGICSLHQKWL